MKSIIARDKKRRKLVSKHELTRLQLKYIIHNEELSNEFRWQASLKLNKMPRNSSKIRVTNRCVLSGRSKSVFRFFKVSRIAFRELASNGLLPGIKKSSW